MISMNTSIDADSAVARDRLASGRKYFSEVLGQAGTSIIGAQNMVKKIYFPRLIIPISKAITAFIDFGVVILIMIICMVIYQFPPSENIIYFPFFFFIANDTKSLKFELAT